MKTIQAGLFSEDWISVVQLERASVVSVQRRSGTPGGVGRTSGGPGYERGSVGNTNASGIQPAP